MTSPASRNAALVQSHRILVGTLTGAPVVMVLVVSFLLPVGDPGALLLAILLVASAAVAAFIPARGYRTGAVEPGLSADDTLRQALNLYQAATVLRFALAEVPVILGIGMGFAGDSLLPCLLGLVISLVLMVLHVWPSRRVVDKSAQALEAGGVDSGLRRAFGY